MRYKDIQQAVIKLIGAMEISSPRLAIDVFAAFAHFVLLIVVCSVNSGGDWSSGAGISLIMMQIVAIFAHIFYAYKLTNLKDNFDQKRNLYKWVEYAVSATLGTVSVFLSADSEPNGSLLALLITLSITIQTVGYSLDLPRQGQVPELIGFLRSPELVQWLSAAVGQAADFGVVGAAVYGRKDWSEYQQNWHFLPYVLGWSSFGLLNLFVLIKYERDPSGESVDNINIEATYSVLSLLAKAFVFGSTGIFLSS